MPLIQESGMQRMKPFTGTIILYCPANWTAATSIHPLRYSNRDARAHCSSLLTSIFNYRLKGGSFIKPRLLRDRHPTRRRLIPFYPRPALHCHRQPECAEPENLPRNFGMAGPGGGRAGGLVRQRWLRFTFETQRLLGPRL